MSTVVVRNKTELIFSFSIPQSKNYSIWDWNNMWVKVITEFYILSNKCVCKCVFVVVFRVLSFSFFSPSLLIS